jgi:endonuclease/exonuclease/phosphatase family metal-dependent hydrolase
VALLYQSEKFRYLGHLNYSIRFPHDDRKRTRDILHVTGQVSAQDTLDVFVCHFPSRRGGEKESEPDRLYVASVIKAKSDSLMQIRENAHIMIMGDFNDEPSDRSLSKILGAQPVAKEIILQDLYNLFYPFERRRNTGTYKFGRQWTVLDQIIVSGSLITGDRTIRVLPHTAGIFYRDFMLTDDRTHGGKRPKKTYHGRRHEGGFSDHFPVLVDFEVTNP